MQVTARPLRPGRRAGWRRPAASVVVSSLACQARQAATNPAAGRTPTAVGEPAGPGAVGGADDDDRRGTAGTSS